MGETFCNKECRANRRAKRVLIAAVAVISIVVATGLYTGFLSYTGFPEPSETPYYVPVGAGKTVAVSGYVQSAAGVASGAIGNMVFFDPATNNFVNSGAVAAAGTFTVNLPSGVAYTAYFQPTGGNAPVWQFKVFTGATVPFVEKESFQTIYQFTAPFTVYAKSTTWTVQLQAGATTTTRTYTAGAWGGTQTGTGAQTYTLTPVAGTPVVFIMTLTNTAANTQLGTEDSFYGVVNGGGQYVPTPIYSWLVVATNRTDSYLYSAPAGSFSFKLNATVNAFGMPVQVVKTGANTQLTQVTFQIMFPTAATGGNLFAWYITNTTMSALQNTGLVSPYPAIWVAFLGRITTCWHLQ